MNSFIEALKNRRSYRKFDSNQFDIEIIISAIEAAKHSPSGANKQPWVFCIVKDPEIKSKIREESEKAEAAFYQNIPSVWEQDLEKLNVDVEKPFLEEAPYLIVVFKQTYQYDENGNNTPVYFPDKSVGIATGILIAALTGMGIQTLTYTPSPNKFLADILERPENETPYMVIVCGKGAKDYKLPNITKKTNDEVIIIY